MKQIFVMAIVFALAFTVGACSNTEPTEPAIPEPVVPAVPDVPVIPAEPTGTDDVVDAAPVEGEAVVIDTSDHLGGGSSEALGSKIEGVACSKEENKVTFSFSNAGESTWSLDQTVGFGASGDLKNVKVFMNHRYEMNSGRTQFHPETREVMFGPNTKFSDNCGGVTELAPGETVECTLYPVPLNEGSGSSDLNSVNYILIDSPNIDDLIEFTC